MGDKLINVARMMKANARSKGSQEQVRLNYSLNANTMEAHSEQADTISGKLRITPEQRKRIQEHRKKAAERTEARARRKPQSYGRAALQLDGWQNPSPARRPYGDATRTHGRR